MRKLDDRIETLKNELTMFANPPDETTALQRLMEKAQSERDGLVGQDAEAGT